MRYQVRAPDAETYSEVAAVLRDQANIVLELPRRRLFAVEAVPSAVLQKIKRMGAVVEPDYQYAVEPVFP